MTVYYEKDRIIDWMIPEPNSGCWLWLGALTETGYGRIRGGLKAHIFSYRLFKGKIPEGLELHHKCRVRSCVNPEHLVAVTHAENTKNRVFKAKTHCPQGHEFTPENTYVRPDGYSSCKICKRAALKRHRNPLEKT